MLHPLDELPVHQTPRCTSQVGTSDKNFYDRRYFNAHVARAVCDGAEGWGLFERASVGAHAPTGFADLMSVAP